MEESDGRVLLRFHSFREPIDLPDTSNSRQSFSNFHSVRRNPLEEPQKYQFRSLIPKQVINEPPSPSSSGIGYGCNVLIGTDFIIDWPFLKEDYYYISDASKCQWFLQINRNLGELLKKEWIPDMQKFAVNIPFFLWFLTFISKKGLSDVYTIPR